MANVFVPTNDPAVFTSNKFPLMKDGDGNTYRTVIKANVNGNIDVYSKGTGLFGADELLFQYNATRGESDFRDGKFKDKPNTAYDSFFLSKESNVIRFLKDVKIVWYQEAPPDAATRMATLYGYKSIAAITQRRTQPRTIAASGTAPASTPEPITKDLPEQIKGEGRKWNSKVYFYPTSIQTNGQDFIKFEILEYQASKIDKKNPTSFEKFEKKYTTVVSLATIILPIQPSITDRNLVEWGNNELNPVQLAGYSLSSAGMSGDANDINSILSKLGDTVTKDENVKKAITLYLKQKALNVEGLLSRFGGAIVNPNLELIFQGPTLRPFDFTFRLSPRDDKEATNVRQIIRAFKEAMAPQVSTGDLFLAAPNVFNISYHTKGKNNEEILHPSLNKIKTCALQSCNVDYTPDGSYMTFNDEKRTMTSYNLTLQFVELEPVTSKDYTDIKIDEIGY